MIILYSDQLTVAIFKRIKVTIWCFEIKIELSIKSLV